MSDSRAQALGALFTVWAFLRGLQDKSAGEVIPEALQEAARLQVGLVEQAGEELSLPSPRDPDTERLRAQVRDLKLTLAAREMEIKDLQARTSRLEGEIESAGKRIQLLSDANARQRGTIAAFDGTIGKLAKKLERAGV